LFNKTLPLKQADNPEDDVSQSQENLNPKIQSNKSRLYRISKERMKRFKKAFEAKWLKEKFEKNKKL